jgi:hypothetical protein
MMNIAEGVYLMIIDLNVHVSPIYPNNGMNLNKTFLLFERGKMTKIIYSSLILIGIIILVLSLISQFYFNFIDVNITKVLIPISFIYIYSISIDYLIRGKYYIK